MSGVFDPCVCGHQRRMHPRHGCIGASASDGWGGLGVPFCRCAGFRDGSAVLPSEGERLVFGVHRQTTGNAETAPAWAPITEGQREAAFNRSLRGRR